MKKKRTIPANFRNGSFLWSLQCVLSHLPDDNCLIAFCGKWLVACTHSLVGQA